jgi:hypothetical protein
MMLRQRATFETAASTDRFAFPLSQPPGGARSTAPSDLHSCLLDFVFLHVHHSMNLRCLSMRLQLSSIPTARAAPPPTPLFLPGPTRLRRRRQRKNLRTTLRTHTTRHTFPRGASQDPRHAALNGVNPAPICHTAITRGPTTLAPLRATTIPKTTRRVLAGQRSRDACIRATLRRRCRVLALSHLTSAQPHC